MRGLGPHPAGPGAERAGSRLPRGRSLALLGPSLSARRPGPASSSRTAPGCQGAPACTLRAGGSRMSRVGTHSSRRPARAGEARSGGSSDSAFPAMGARGGPGVDGAASGSRRPRSRDLGVGAWGGARTGPRLPRPLAGRPAHLPLGSGAQVRDAAAESPALPLSAPWSQPWRPESMSHLLPVRSAPKIHPF